MQTFGPDRRARSAFSPRGPGAARRIVYPTDYDKKLGHGAPKGDSGPGLRDGTLQHPQQGDVLRRVEERASHGPTPAPRLRETPTVLAAEIPIQTRAMVVE